MKKLIYTILLIGAISNANAQLGDLKKLKGKTQKVTKKASSTTTNTTKTNESKTADSREMTSTLKIEKEAKAQLDLLVQYFEGGNLGEVPKQDIEKALDQLKTKVTTLKNYYASYSTQLKTLQEGHNKYKNLAYTEFQRRNSTDKIAQEIGKMSRAVNDFKTKQDGWMIAYSDFLEQKTAFNQLTVQDESIKNDIKNIDDYFDQYLPNTYAPVLEKELIESTLDVAFDKEKWQRDPDYGLSRLETHLDERNGFVSEYKDKFKDQKALEAIKAKMLAQQSFLIDYRDNGGFKKYKESVRLEKAKRVFPSKESHKDASINAMVSKSHNKEKYGTIKKITIIYDWDVNKNDLGIPIDKELVFEVVAQHEGNCYLYRGRVYRTYEGGGKYGSKTVSGYFRNELMHCDNINKTRE